MRKIFALFSFLVLFTACSDDDEVNGSEQIVGSWMLADWNIPLPDFEEGPSECNLESNITFNTDNTATSEFYEEVEEEVENECMAETQSGEWEAHGDGEYTIQVPGIGQQTGTVDFEGDNQFTFSLSIGSMTFVRQ